LIGEKVLVGAVVMGDQTVSTPLQNLIAGKADISPIREKLLARDAKIADAVIDFWKQWSSSRIVM
jgi:NAD(P)H-nitrite reductase large subunit